MSLELPAKADLNDTPTVDEYKAALGALHDFIDSGFFDPAAGGGSADAQTATLGETDEYKTGRIYRVKPGATNTGACTFNFDGLGDKNVKLIDGTDPWAGAITSGIPADFLYNGTSLVLLNPCPAAGTIIQKVVATSTANVTNSTGSLTDVGISITITPRFSNSLIVVDFNGHGRIGNDGGVSTSSRSQTVAITRSDNTLLNYNDFGRVLIGSSTQISASFHEIYLRHSETSGGTTAKTYKIRHVSTSGSLHSQIHGATGPMVMTAEEIKQ